MDICKHVIPDTLSPLHRERIDYLAGLFDESLPWHLNDPETRNLFTKLRALPIRLLNRTAVTIIPRQPYIDWANSIDDNWPKYDLDEPDNEYTVYLIDETGDNTAARRIVQRHCAFIFEYELAAWCVDEDTWPPKRDWRTFKQWFEVQINSMVIDLGKRLLLIEEFD